MAEERERERERGSIQFRVWLGQKLPGVASLDNQMARAEAPPEPLRGGTWTVLTQPLKELHWIANTFLRPSRLVGQ